VFRLKPYKTLFFCVLFTTQIALGQNVGGEKSYGLNEFLGFDGLRPNNPSQIYDVEFLRDSSYYLVRFDEDSPFETYKKLLYSYDNQGQLTLEHEYLRDQYGWVDAGLHEYQYGSNGGLEYKVSSYWDSESQAFIQEQRRRYEMNFFGLVHLEIIESQIDGQWRYAKKLQFAYNDQNRLSEETKFIWSADSFSWQPSSKVLYSYNDNHDVQQQISQIWDMEEQIWENASLQGFEYNDDEQLINLQQSVWNDELNRWEEAFFQSITYTPLGQVENAQTFDSKDLEATESVQAIYDEHGNLNTSLFREWNAEAEEWITLEKHIHYWSENITGNASEVKEKVQCFYINPHVVGLPWYCESLISDEDYTLTIYDLNGIKMHQQVFRGGSTFSIERSLPNGLYMAVIEGGLTRHTEKVLIRN
jgi:hypothetical protein